MKLSLSRENKTSELSTSINPKRKRNAKDQEQYKSSRKKKIKSGRKCKICGNDPYPNYFFCPACHHRIGAYEEDD